MAEEKMEKKKERPKYNMWQNTIYMIKKAWGVRKSVLVLCFSMVILSTLVNLTELFIAPAILQKIEIQAQIKELLLTILFFATVTICLTFVHSYTNENLLFGRVEIRIHLMKEIHYKVATTSYPNTEDTMLQEKLERAYEALANNYRATQAVWETLTDILKNIIGFGIYLYLLSAVDAFLLLVVTITSVIGYFVNKYLYEWGYRHREEEDGYINKMAYIAKQSEDVKMAKDIRIFGMYNWLKDIFESTLRLYEGFLKRKEKSYLCAAIVDVVLSVLRNGIAYVYLIHMVLNQNFSASEFLLYFTAVSGFTTWVTGILSGFVQLHEQSIELSIVREYIETKEPFLFEEGISLVAEMDKEYIIELRDVSFRYPGAEKDTLSHVNLVIHPKEKIAVVGLNGAGKTTLVKLIIGLYDPTEGAVLLNGTDIRKLNRQDYYKLFSAVFQQFSLLEVSIAENVAQSANKIDRKKVKECISKAGLEGKLRELPQSYDTHLGRLVYEDGIELSGGETQRLMLARALYKDAPMMVLDEPTAALDPIAENDIYLKYHEMTKNRTSIYISHRLASTRFCDRIIFLESGTIAEEGTHDSLLSLKGKYAQLFEIQSRYYREGGTCNEE